MTARRLLLLACVLTAATPAAAQQVSPFSLDAVVAADGDTGSFVPHKPTSWIDVFGAVRMAEGLDLRARPVIARRSFDGKWQTQIYELALRYERHAGVSLRFDGGQISSPVGLAILENRPDVNPVVSQHSTLYMPVPRYEPGTPMTYLLAAAYPLGAQMTASTHTWDARLAVVDSSPIRGRSMMGANKPPRMANFIVGGGVTPRAGLRFGASFAHGPYATADEVRDPSRGDREATLGQVEAEWSFGYMRIAGEWLWTTRQMAVDSATVSGGWIEATRTISPRLFATVRYDRQGTEWTSIPDHSSHDDYYARVESALGVRVTPQLTLRASYLTRKGYVLFFWDDQFLASVVWARKFK